MESNELLLLICCFNQHFCNEDKWDQTRTNVTQTIDLLVLLALFALDLLALASSNVRICVRLVLSAKMVNNASNTDLMYVSSNGKLFATVTVRSVSVINNN